MNSLKGLISEKRFSPYLTETHGDEDLAFQLYSWDRDISAALFEQIAYIEVALRNRIDDALVSRWGENWHIHSATIFDKATYQKLNEAWNILDKKYQTFSNFEESKNDTRRGRLIASCTFGTWKLMFTKGKAGIVEGLSSHIYHDETWNYETIRIVFPKIRREARKHRIQERELAYKRIQDVHILRNRIAHHESLINGYPLPGQNIRLDINDAYNNNLALAKLIDVKLYKFLKNDTKIQDIMKSKPPTKRKGRKIRKKIWNVLR